MVCREEVGIGSGRIRVGSIVTCPQVLKIKVEVIGLAEVDEKSESMQVNAADSSLKS